MPDREQARRHPDRDTLEAGRGRRRRGAGARHSATRAFAKVAATMATVDLWHARLALKTLRLDQRQAIAEAAEG